MTRSGFYASYLPQLPPRPSTIAIAKRPSPMKRYAPIHPMEGSLYSANKRQKISLEKMSMNSTAMYSVYTPGPQNIHTSYMNEQCTTRPFNFYTTARSAEIVPTNKGNAKSILCCGFQVQHTDSPSYVSVNKENADYRCPKCPSTKRTRSPKQVKRRSPTAKSRKKIAQKESSCSKNPLSYNNFLVTLEKESTLRTAAESVNTRTGYSSGFVPKLTSTPQQAPRKYSMYLGAMSTKQFSENGVDRDVKSVDLADVECKAANVTDEVLDNFLKHSDKNDLPVNLSDKTIAKILGTIDTDTTEKMKDQKSSSQESDGSKDGNNNKKQKRNKRKLPGMYPLGAPRAASSPIHRSTRKVSCEIYEDIDCGKQDLFPVTPGRIEAKTQMIVLSRPLANLTNHKDSTTTTMWRPW